MFGNHVAKAQEGSTAVRGARARGGGLRARATTASRTPWMEALLWLAAILCAPCLVCGEAANDHIELKLSSRSSGVDRRMNAFNRHLNAIAVQTSPPLPSLAELLGRVERALELGCGEALAMTELLWNLERAVTNQEAESRPCVAGMDSYAHALKFHYLNDEKAAASDRAQGRIVTWRATCRALLS
eukprot:3999799-Prymnesium_polylepis.1